MDRRNEAPGDIALDTMGTVGSRNYAGRPI